MIKRLLQRVFSPRKKTGETSASSLHNNSVTIPLRTHGITRDLISTAALKTVAGLQDAGFEAYVVGGAVRDLLVKLRPKDFDVATNATPEQVRRIFRRARIIGRRFRLVHVMFGSETVEVSTFRSSQPDDDNAKVAENGRILRDNVFGNQEQDAVRRDFTANALYYDPSREVIIDFHGGVADIKNGRLRVIGDPTTRYREDPVRMLRAVRLAAKLKLQLDSGSEAPIQELAHLLQDVPESRLFDEMLKLFLSGYAGATIRELCRLGLHHSLFPPLQSLQQQPESARFIQLAMENTDARVLDNKRVSPSFLFATLLWHEVLDHWKKNQLSGLRPVPALQMAMTTVTEHQAETLAIHKRYSGAMREIWGMQPRFEYRAGKRPYTLLEHPRFRAAYDFLLLRCAAGEIPQEIGDWWTSFARADGDARAAMLLPGTGSAPKKRRRRSRRPKTARQDASASTKSEQAA